MARGLEKDLPFTKAVDKWFRDFLNVVNLIYLLQVKTYRLNKIDKVKASTLSYQSLANDFQDKVKVSRSDTRPLQVRKGSFRATFARQGADIAIDISDISTFNDTDRKQIASKQKPDSKKEKGKQIYSQTGLLLEDQESSLGQRSLLSNQIKCYAYNQGHDFTQYYYLFLNKAPEQFVPKVGIIE